ncbi:MAG: family 43 glycosylhydrolase [Eubacteriales bacterium]|jgi:hypothetical protein
MQSYCNPLDLGYRYQHFNENGRLYASREGADPTLILFKGTYYLFVSMSAGFWYSDDLKEWKFHANPDLLIYDYAPDVRQIGDYMVFSASRRSENCPFLRTKDPLSDEFEEVSAPFPFWDPDIFQDEDGRVYFYWGCSNVTPIWGVELDPETLLPLGEKQVLVCGRETELGFERSGEKKEDSQVYLHLKAMFNEETQRIELPEGLTAAGYNAELLTAMFLSIGKPYIEGAFMTKHDGKYYLQYACPATEKYNYSDGVYVSDSPLGPFTLQKDNPFSCKPGGFITGAGHGSTIQDKDGNWWHAATMRISINHAMERRVGLFPAGFDEEGTLFCNQNFADYPVKVPEGKFDARELSPEWMLLSYNKPVTVSSTAEGSDPSLAVNEDIQNWWSAASAEPGEWLCVDLEKLSDVRAIQLNLADQDVAVAFPAEAYGDSLRSRHIELEPQISHYRIEASADGKSWTLLEDVARECSNGYYEYPEGVQTRFIRVTGGELPYGQRLRISGLRVFGNGSGEKPAAVEAAAVRTGDMDARITWSAAPTAQGYNVRYGLKPDKLYHSWLVYDATELDLTTLMKGQDYWLCVDSFNENGITEGETIYLGKEIDG